MAIIQMEEGNEKYNENLDLAELTSGYPTRKSDESQLKYQSRLHVYCVGLIGVIEACEGELNLERMGEIGNFSKRLDQAEDEEAVRETIDLIKKYQKKVSQYEKALPGISEKYPVSKRGKALRDYLD